VKQLARIEFVSLVGMVALKLTNCSDHTRGHSASAATDAGVPEDAGSPNPCGPIQGQPIPARLAVMSADAAPTTTAIFVDDIFSRFSTTCGGCHVAANQGGFQTNRGNFADHANQTMLDRLSSDDPTYYMPPPSAGGKPASQRSADDPVTQLATLIREWLAAGKPAYVFYLDNPDAGGSDQPFLMAPDRANSLTNIGDCLPLKTTVATEQAKMDALDALFAASAVAPPGRGTLVERIGLPERLEDTDLFTLDTAALARHGVIAYAPAYPLWSDDAGKLRHVRVPRGQSITFDRANQKLVIPPNTRFYKTFLKKITDTDGSTRYRKIETRLIVSRPDQAMPNGSLEPTAIFGTYAWNDLETEAVLLTDPLRNGEPFSDRVITYVTDEPAAAAITASNPLSLSYALQSKQAVRHYAIPGSDRCLDCHRGSPSQSFVLGFTPLQVKRRPTGEGGVIEPAAPDELTQLGRLLDYGVVTGVDSPDDLALLEDSQADRKPRNDFELTAQGYLLGNCAHCHNPNGDASVDNPVLADVLNFMPGPVGGIFQFPLDRLSPRIARGPAGSVPIPYVTPSLADLPVENNGSYNWTPKADAEALWATNVNSYMSPSLSPPGAPTAAVFAPWRSLIYRNVDTPFAYSDDFGLFPHMPKNVPGYDCRLPGIIGDWMASIPARRKQPTIFEYAVPVGGTCLLLGKELCDAEPQPYQEVQPEDADYQTALDDAAQRLGMYHSGVPYWIRPSFGPFPNRYAYCPDTSDIVDPTVLVGGIGVCSPKVVPASGQVFDSASHTLVMPDVGVPLRPHWVVTDLTDIPGPYFPRRPDWQKIIVEQSFPTITGNNCNVELARQASEKVVVAELQDVSLSSRLRDYALKPVPMGLWVKQPSCDLSTAPTLADYASDRPKWADRLQPPPSQGSPVYTELPGSAVFRMVCTNCHGPAADAHGRMADNLMTMTGGSVRVANLRDGLFGPVGSGSNRQEVFGGAASALGIAADDLAARYLAWMALGGTLARIPPAILNIVGNTQVLGVPRKTNAFQSISASSANMLATAQELCRHVLPWQLGYDKVPFDVATGSFSYEHSALIPTNGDAELWQSLCSINNEPPIRGLTAVDWNATPVAFVLDPYQNLYRPSGYPADTPVGDHHGKVAPLLGPDNVLPWCIVTPSDAGQAAIAQKYAVDNAIDGTPLPLCPDSLLSGNHQMLQDPPSLDNGHDDLGNWATRGAINAGMAVFLYLDQIVVKGLKPVPAYDRCEAANP
jgi:mono/diheme cytochrome c family protein